MVESSERLVSESLRLDYFATHIVPKHQECPNILILYIIIGSTKDYMLKSVF